MDPAEILHEGIVGQAFAQRMLANMIRREMIPHAALLWGPAGVGKLSLAKSFAAALDCTGRGDSVSACGSCSSCRLLASGNHPDVRVVEPDGRHIRIDQIRDTIEAVSYRSYSSKWKVWIFRHADLMTEQAANSLLKILEDPPSNTVFILTAQNLYSILPTVVSRCRLVRLSLVPQETIEHLLLTRHGVSKEQARIQSYLCGGSVGAALEACSDQSLDEGRLAAIQSIRDLAGKPTWEVLAAAAHVNETTKGLALDRFLHILSYWYRDLLICRTVQDMDRVANIDMLDEARADSQRYSVAGLIRRLRYIFEAQRQLAANASAGLVLDRLYLALSALD